MIKVLDKYIIKTFFGPFFFIFSVLFFIFLVNIIWIQLGQIMGKGFTYYEILKFFFFVSPKVVSMVLPLTILLASIMTFGEFGERYELAAMKASGISLTRVMSPLFFISILLACILFLFSNTISPNLERKALNMRYSIAISKPALNFTEGNFIDQIPSYIIKFDKTFGENKENIEGVYIHKKASNFDNQQTIRAEKGKLFVAPENKKFLKLILYNGSVFEENIANKGYDERNKQPDQMVKFDTLVSYFDISELMDKAIEQERITDDYRFLNFTELFDAIAKTKQRNLETFNAINSDLLSQLNPYLFYIEKSEKSKFTLQPQFNFDTLRIDQKIQITNSALEKIENLKTSIESKFTEIAPAYMLYSRTVVQQQKIFTFSVTCVIFFLIGGSLGSIIRKGGMGLPVIIAIIIFIIYYFMQLTVENFAWDGTLNPYLAIWLPNIIMFPFGIWLSYKALTDSQLFDIEKYKSLIKPISKFWIKNKEHKRYL